MILGYIFSFLFIGIGIWGAIISAKDGIKFNPFAMLGFLAGIVLFLYSIGVVR